MDATRTVDPDPSKDANPEATQPAAPVEQLAASLWYPLPKPGNTAVDEHGFPKMGFYMNMPAESRALFSTNRGNIEKRQLTGLFEPRKDTAYWSNRKIQSKCNRLREKFAFDMKYMGRPQTWLDLYDYFDASDLYYQGAYNLWNVIQHLCDENVELRDGLIDDMRASMEDWVEEWLENSPENVKKLAYWDMDSNVLELLSEEDWNLHARDMSPMLLWILKMTLQEWHYSFACKSDFFSYQQASARCATALAPFLESRQYSVYNWLAGTTTPTKTSPPGLDPIEELSEQDAAGSKAYATHPEIVVVPPARTSSQPSPLLHKNSGNMNDDLQPSNSDEGRCVSVGHTPQPSSSGIQPDFYTPKKKQLPTSAKEHAASVMKHEMKTTLTKKETSTGQVKHTASAQNVGKANKSPAHHLEKSKKSGLKPEHKMQNKLVHTYSATNKPTAKEISVHPMTAGSQVRQAMQTDNPPAFVPTPHNGVSFSYGQIQQHQVNAGLPIPPQSYQYPVAPVIGQRVLEDTGYYPNGYTHLPPQNQYERTQGLQYPGTQASLRVSSADPRFNPPSNGSRMASAQQLSSRQVSNSTMGPNSRNQSWAHSRVDSMHGPVWRHEPNANHRRDSTINADGNHRNAPGRIGQPRPSCVNTANAASYPDRNRDYQDCACTRCEKRSRGILIKNPSWHQARSPPLNLTELGAYFGQWGPVESAESLRPYSCILTFARESSAIAAVNHPTTHYCPGIEEPLLVEYPFFSRHKRGKRADHGGHSNAPRSRAMSNTSAMSKNGMQLSHQLSAHSSPPNHGIPPPPPQMGYPQPGQFPVFIGPSFMPPPGFHHPFMMHPGMAGPGMGPQLFHLPEGHGPVLQQMAALPAPEPQYHAPSLHTTPSHSSQGSVHAVREQAIPEWSPATRETAREQMAPTVAQLIANKQASDQKNKDRLSSVNDEKCVREAEGETYQSKPPSEEALSDVMFPDTPSSKASGENGGKEVRVSFPSTPTKGKKMAFEYNEGDKKITAAPKASPKAADVKNGISTEHIEHAEKVKQPVIEGNVTPPKITALSGTVSPNSKGSPTRGTKVGFDARVALPLRPTALQTRTPALNEEKATKTSTASQPQQGIKGVISTDDYTLDTVIRHKPKGQTRRLPSAWTWTAADDLSEELPATSSSDITVSTDSEPKVDATPFDGVPSKKICSAAQAEQPAIYEAAKQEATQQEVAKKRNKKGTAKKNKKARVGEASGLNTPAEQSRTATPAISEKDDTKKGKNTDPKPDKGNTFTSEDELTLKNGKRLLSDQVVVRNPSPVPTPVPSEIPTTRNKTSAPPQQGETKTQSPPRKKKPNKKGANRGAGTNTPAPGGGSTTPSDESQTAGAGSLRMPKNRKHKSAHGGSAGSLYPDSYRPGMHGPSSPGSGGSDGAPPAAGGYNPDDAFAAQNTQIDLHRRLNYVGASDTTPATDPNAIPVPSSGGPNDVLPPFAHGRGPAGSPRDVASTPSRSPAHGGSVSATLSGGFRLNPAATPFVSPLRGCGQGTASSSPGESVTKLAGEGDQDGPLVRDAPGVAAGEARGQTAAAATSDREVIRGGDGEGVPEAAPGLSVPDRSAVNMASYASRASSSQKATPENNKKDAPTSGTSRANSPTDEGCKKPRVKNASPPGSAGKQTDKASTPENTQAKTPAGTGSGGSTPENKKRPQPAKSSSPTPPKQAGNKKSGKKAGPAMPPAAADEWPELPGSGEKAAAAAEVTARSRADSAWFNKGAVGGGAQAVQAALALAAAPVPVPAPGAQDEEDKEGQEETAGGSGKRRESAAQLLREKHEREDVAAERKGG